MEGGRRARSGRRTRPARHAGGRAKLAAEQAHVLADREQSAARAAQFELGAKYYAENEYALARDVWSALAEADPANAEIQRYLQKTNAALHAQPQAQADEARRLEGAGDWVNALGAWSRVHAADAADAEAEVALSAAARRSNAGGTACGQPRPHHEREKPAERRGRKHGVPGRRERVRRRRPAARRGASARRAQTDPANAEAARLLAKAERQMQPLGSEDRARVRDLYLRGMGFFTASQFEKAIAEWSKILEIDPGNKSVYENIREARARLRALQP